MENPTRVENKNANNSATSDTAEIVRRHLEDKNHEITDEEIRNIRVVGEEGGSISEAGAEPSLLKAKEEIDNTEENNLPGENTTPTMPWDTVK